MASLTLLRPGERYRSDPEFLDFYAREDPEGPPLYGPPEQISSVQTTPLRSGEGIERLKLTFPSPYRPLNPGYTARLGDRLPCGEVRARLVQPSPAADRAGTGMPEPGSAEAGGEPWAETALVLIHGWVQNRLDLLERRWAGPMARGLAVPSALLMLPYHMDRITQGERFHGEHFISADLPRTIEALVQSVQEALALAAWLRDRGARRVGVMGFSLGGLIAALAAAAEPDLDLAVVAEAPCNLADLIYSSLRLYYVRRDARDQGISHERLCAVLRAVTPEHFTPAIPSDRVLIVHGHYDLTVPPVHAERLQEAWGRPPICWYPGGHGDIHLHSRSILGAIAEHIERVPKTKQSI